MFSVTLLRVLRPRVVTLASIQLTTAAAAAARHGAQISASCWRLSRRTQTHAVRRSFLQTDDQVQSQCSFSRCLSTAAHSIDGNLIYTGSLGSAIRGVKLFSYSSSGASLLLMPQILLKTGLGVQTFALQAAFCGVIGFFTFITPVLLHLLTKGYVIRLYHNPVRDTYTAITYSVLLTEKKSVFHQSEVKVPAVSGMFTTFYAGHTGLLVNPELFPIPHDYNHLMGYDKPFSFDPDDKNNPDDS